MQNINELCQRIHNLNKQWWHDATGNPITRNRGELIALMHSELSEALDGILQGNIKDDHLPNRLMEEAELADTVIRLCDYVGGFGYDIEADYKQFLDFTKNDGCIFVTDAKTSQLCEIHHWLSKLLESERKGRQVEALRTLAMIFVYIENYCQMYAIDLEGAIEEKLVYNAQRADHKHENRIKEDGKKF